MKYIPLLLLIMSAFGCSSNDNGLTKATVVFFDKPIEFNWCHTTTQTNDTTFLKAEYYKKQNVIVCNSDTFALQQKQNCCWNSFIAIGVEFDTVRIKLYGDTAMIYEDYALLTIGRQNCKTIGAFGGYTLHNEEDTSLLEEYYEEIQYLSIIGDFLISPQNAFYLKSDVSLYTDVKNNYVCENIEKEDLMYHPDNKYSIYTISNEWCFGAYTNNGFETLGTYIKK